MAEREAIAKTIEKLTASLAYSDKDDKASTMNVIRRLKHKINEIDGVENACDIQDNECLSCGA